MLDDYKLAGSTLKLDVTIEKEVHDLIQKMANHMKITTSELTNTALKRFIAAHKDFLPFSRPA